jgi:hypothetical protein
VHWHGLRLENRFDGVPHKTQAPIPVGGGYSCRVQFPDAGFYWYHPHMREDFAQEMGLYGTIVVEPADPAYWPAVDRELTLTLHDLLVEDGHVAAFSRSGPNFTAMGRFGNVLLINGQPEELAVRQVGAGPVVGPPSAGVVGWKAAPASPSVAARIPFAQLVTSGTGPARMPSDGSRPPPDVRLARRTRGCPTGLPASSGDHCANDSGPHSHCEGHCLVVAGAGFEPATSGL